MNYPEFLDPIETAPRDELDRQQEAALVAMAAYAYSRAPLIRETWDAAGLTPADIRARADFTGKVPFITKDSIREFRDRNNDPAGGMGHYGPGEILNVGTTSGTTGDPTPIPGGRYSPAEKAYARDLWHFGLRPGDHHMHVLFTFRGGHRRRLMQELGIIDINFSMDRREVPRLCEASRRYRPVTANNIPKPMLDVLERHFERTGEDPTDVFKSYKASLIGGEPLSARMAKLTKSWGLELYETTSLGDVCSATECEHRTGMHAYEDMAFIECIDPLGDEPLADGEVGELVVTTLVDRFSPLIRYRTGDLVTLDHSPCACGRAHVRFRVLGRTTDQILVDGRSILPREIMGVIELHEETRTGLFQIIRSAREMDALRLRVGYDAGRLGTSVEILHARIHDSVHAAVGVPTAIELVAEADLLKLGPPHKIPRVTRA